MQATIAAGGIGAAIRRIAGPAAIFRGQRGFGAVFESDAGVFDVASRRERRLQAHAQDQHGQQDQAQAGSQGRATRHRAHSSRGPLGYTITEARRADYFRNMR